MDQKGKRIVILGAGFGGTYVLRRLHKHFHGRSGVRITVVNANNYFLFTPLLHEVATGNLWPENLVESVRELFPCCAIDFFLGEVLEIKTAGKSIVTTRGEVPYDYAVIALGAETNFYDIPGAREHTFPLKSLEDAIELKNHFIHSFEHAAQTRDERERARRLHFVVAGGGPTGVELAAEMAEFFYKTFGKLYDEDLMRAVKITLIESGNRLLSRFSEPLQKKALRVLEGKGVAVKFRTNITRVSEWSAELDTGENIETHTVAWTAGVKPHDLKFDISVERDERGRILVDGHLRLKGCDNVFVLGDMASFTDEKTNAPLPQLAQVAVKEGVFVADSIARLLDGQIFKPFSYRRSGDLVSLGTWMAAGEIGMFYIWGHLTWVLWRTVYFSKLLSYRKKVQVGVDWILNTFAPRDTSELYKRARGK